MATALHTSRAEVSADTVRQEFALLSAEYAELLAHVRAAVAAARDGEVDPMAHLAGFLEERGQLPPDGMSASRLVAEAFARTADTDRQFGGCAVTGISDWPAYVNAVTAADEARLWDQGAEEALDQAVDIAGTRREADEFALIGIGMALRATNARLEALTDELAGIADALAAPRPAPQRSWWRRLTSVFAGHRPSTVTEACPDDLDSDGGGDLGDVAPAESAGATVTPLRRTGARA